MTLYLVLGLGPAGLFVSRQLAKREKCVVIGIGKRDDIGIYSNKLNHYYISEDIVSFKNILEDITSKYTDIVPILCSDQYLSLLVQCDTAILSRMHFSSPSLDTLWLFADKVRLQEFCQRINLKMPYSTTLSNVCVMDNPLVIKPAVKAGISKVGKINVINTQDDLVKLKNKILDLGEDPNDYIVQPFIQGNNGYEYGYGGYFCEGKPTIDIYFYQLRQYPQGVCCHTLEILDENLKKNIRETVTPFLVSTKYSGFIQFDIKQDAENLQLYVLDINPRPWGSISMLSLKLSDGTSLWADNGTNNKVAWRFPIKEFLSLKNRNNVSYKEIWRIRRKTRYSMVVDLFDKNDILPFLIQPVVILHKLFK